MSAETLLDIFAPPEGMVGHSAALVAMTGAEDFLEDAVQRFTGLRPRQRAELGNTRARVPDAGRSMRRSSRQEVFPPGRIPESPRVPARATSSLVRSCMRRSRCWRTAAPNRTRNTPVHPGRLAVLTANYTYTSARQRGSEVGWCGSSDLPLVGSTRVEDRADVAGSRCRSWRRSSRGGSTATSRRSNR